MRVDRLEASVYTVPNEGSRTESDGTLAWDGVTIVVVEAVSEEGVRGLGYTYGPRATAAVVEDQLRSSVEGRPLEEHRDAWEAMVRSVRNAGRPGIGAMAISAVDCALWDLRARQIGLPLYQLLGVRRTEVPIYGSGGYTSYEAGELVGQLRGWVEEGISRVKMKVGVDRGQRPEQDLSRIEAVREAIGAEPELFIDANGAYSAKQVIGMAGRLHALGVVYCEEPVSSDQLEEMALIRQTVPFDVAAGEYGYDPWYFRTMVDAQAVDVLQADVTRCLGITGWLEAAALAHACGLPFSAHCCPSLTVHPACAVPQIAHLEYFFDHARAERMLFDGAPSPAAGGVVRPDPGRPGCGLELKRQEAEPLRVA
jgi:L-alanine-DL-glutamate epimerase-like enolase superfamily enzyme